MARAITVLESSHPADHVLAEEVLTSILPFTGNAIRIGLSGVPGVGKSTFIDQFGSNLCDEGRQIAVLAVDPTSSRTGGSILGDKTRMERLATNPAAFIRPSPAGRTLGGVNRVTRESMLVCEAAGFDTIIIETVGVGQSETAVADMVDCFCVLMLPGAGDDLQGIKKGIIELADIIAVNKADGDGTTRAELAASEYRHALHLLAPTSPHWSTPVLTCSGQTNQGLDKVWETIQQHHERMSSTGDLEERRTAQQLRWMWSLVDQRLQRALRTTPGLDARVAELEYAVQRAELPVGAAVQRIWDAFVASLSPDPAQD